MQVKFTGFKVAPFRNHIMVEVNKRHIKVGLNEILDLPEEDAYRLRSTGEFELVAEHKPAVEHENKSGRSTVQQPPAASNRAILSGKVE